MASFGSVYRRGRVWWVQYCHRGQVFRESSRSASKSEATSLLQVRLGEIGSGRPLGSRAQATFDELVGMLERDYAINQRKSARDVPYRVAHLRPHFGAFLASEINYERLTRYFVARRGGACAEFRVSR